MKYITENYLVIGIVLVGSVVAFSVLVRVLSERYIRKFGSMGNSSGLDGQKFVDCVLEREGLDVRLVETEKVNEWEYVWGEGTVKVPKLEDSSLLALGVSAHELGHAAQARDKELMAGVTAFVEEVGNFISYLLPVVIIAGFVFYLPLLTAGMILYLLVFLVSMVKVPSEIDASSRGLTYLDRYGNLTEQELTRLKKLLWLAILTRITDLTVGFLTVFDFNDRRWGDE